ncbi:outer membrane p25 [Rodentibacter pneumotropicus]|uniref:Outer membrane p25 n=1 Tax=Rodentibacter pneumotropicus TaxID=758 RepID=A0A448MTK8_9PAST|nr:outer membrane p25 [Rodentibacter pneumotropicus]
MKNVLKVTALSVGIALASGFAAADENIAFINAGYLFQNHPDRQAIADKLDSELKPTADKLAASKKKLIIKLPHHVKSRSKIEALKKMRRVYVKLKFKSVKKKLISSELMKKPH